MIDPDVEVVIIGAGLGGIAAAHLLQQRGIDDFVIVERGDDFGGTWRDNHYPGLAVDIPTLWYQLSFARNPDWPHFFAPGPEIHRYLQDTARGLDLHPHLRTGAEVVRQQWDDDTGLWRLTIRDQPELPARFVISSVGGYVNAKDAVDVFSRLPPFNTYFVNSQRDTVYHRPQTITGSRRFARRSALGDYVFSRRCTRLVPTASPKEHSA